MYKKYNLKSNFNTYLVKQLLINIKIYNVKQFDFNI